MPLPHRNVLAVTGFEEALAIYADTASFSSVNSVTGPIPDLPFAAAGDDIAQQITDHRSQFPFGMEVSGLDAPLHAQMCAGWLLAAL